MWWVGRISRFRKTEKIVYYNTFLDLKQVTMATWQTGCSTTCYSGYHCWISSFNRFKIEYLRMIKSFPHTAWKLSRYGVFSDPYFPAFGLNTERYSLSLHIHSECGKIQTRKNPVFGHFSCSGSVPTESAMRTKYSNGPDWK